MATETRPGVSTSSESSNGATGRTPTRSRTRTGTAQRGSFFKRNKTAVLLGGGGLVLLLMGHKGSSTSAAPATDPNAMLMPPQGFAPAPVDTSAGASGGGDGTGGAPSADNPGNSSAGTNGSGGGDNSSGTSTTSGEGTPSTSGATPSQKGKGTKKKSTHTKRHTHDKKAANPHSNHSGGHGVTVHGRTFPGASGHHVGPARRVGGNVVQEVTVYYGGHSDKHVSVNSGQNWRDHAAGPPSRRAAATHARTVSRPRSSGGAAPVRRRAAR